MTGYEVKIIELSKELSPKERVKIKDTTDCIQLDEATQQGDVVIDYQFHAVLGVHNEFSDNTDYKKYVIVAQDETRYITGSESLFTSLVNITKEMQECGEQQFEIKISRKESKNYKGKEFLTCSLV